LTVAQYRELTLGVVAQLPSERDIARTVRAASNEADSHHGTHPTRLATKTPGARAQIVEWLNTFAASGLAPTTIRVGTAIAAHAIKIGCSTVNLSQREIAERAGVDVSTVNRHVTKLGDWIDQPKHGSRTSGTRTTWRIRFEMSARSCNKPEATYLRCRTGLLQNRARADTFAGRSARWQLANVLDDEPKTARELAATLGKKNARHVQRLLRLIEAAGYATKTDVGWIAAEPNDETTDIADARAKGHRAEREVFRRYLCSASETEPEQSEVLRHGR
jgi:hypothetical protein